MSSSSSSSSTPTATAMDFLTWFIHVGVWLATLLLLYKGFYLRRKFNPPPGPIAWPIVGNFNLIGPYPHRSIHELTKKYGPLMQMKLGSYSVVVASSVDVAKQFLHTHDAIFIGRPQMAVGKYCTYNYCGISWCEYGPYWRQARKMCMTELCSMKQIESYEYIRFDETRRLINMYYKTAGKELPLKHDLSDMSLDVMSRIVLGKKYTSKDSKETIVTPTEFKKMLHEFLLLNGVFNIGDFMPWLGFLDIQGYVKRMKAVAKKFDRFLEHVINEHNEKRKRVENWVTRDMMDVLLQISESQNLKVNFDRNGVKAFCLDMIAGGSENSAVIVEWAIAELIKNPNAYANVKEELDRVIGKERWVKEKDVAQLPYLEAVVKETMRMHPVAPMLVPRITREDCQINGYDIRAGTQALVSVWTIGRDPTLWEKPDDFLPERFIGKSMDVKGADFELLPFGSGRRMCPGYALGLTVIYSNLANLLHGFSWRLPDKMRTEDLNMDENPGFGTTMKIPLVAVVEPRLSANMYEI